MKDSPSQATPALWIMIAGPISSPEAQALEDNLSRLNRAAQAVRDRGHVPIIAHHLAAPLRSIDDPRHARQNYLALCDALTDRCDGVLQVAPSPGADREVARFSARGPAVYHQVADIPSREA